MVRDDLSSVGCRGPKLAWVVPRHSCMGGFLKKILESRQTIMIRWYGRKAEKLSPDGFPLYTTSPCTVVICGYHCAREYRFQLYQRNICVHGGDIK